MITTTRRILRPGLPSSPNGTCTARWATSANGPSPASAAARRSTCARCDRHCTCADRSPLQQAIADEIRRLGCR